MPKVGPAVAHGYLLEWEKEKKKKKKRTDILSA